MDDVYELAAASEYNMIDIIMYAVHCCKSSCWIYYHLELNLLSESCQVIW